MIEKILHIVAAILMTLMFMIFNEFNGFERTVCLISAMVLIELWLLNDKK